jgi:hypothetical protein
MSKPKHYVHGEVNFFQVDGIPKSAKKHTPEATEICAAGFIVGESETTGNHHCVEADPKKVEVFMDKDQMFLSVKAPVKVSCLHQGRHDTMILPVGDYKRNIAQEYDYLAEAKRNVAD